MHITLNDEDHIFPCLMSLHNVPLHNTFGGGALPGFAKLNMISKPSIEKQPCFHCGDPCMDTVISGEKHFCCNGCKQVFLLLSENNLCAYYDLDAKPGIRAMGKFTGGRFAFLEDPAVIQKLAAFISDRLINVTFSLPQIHCSSCIYLLENLPKIDAGIISSRSNFQRKEIFISFDPALISLRKVVELLAFLGYEPALSLNEMTEDKGKKENKASAFNRKKIYRIGVAGFCFANIMMLSFPEYFSSAGSTDASLKYIFSLLNLALSLPVLFYCASVIYISAFRALRKRDINIDVPIALALTVTFSRSYYEIITGTGPGYLDSGCGIVFFMLVGTWFRDKTYDALLFDRDYRSFLPLGITALRAGKEITIPLTSLNKGECILVRNGEIIPADAILISENASIDYSFVTGENVPVHKNTGDLVHAGGKQTGSAIQLEVVKDVSNSYITDLWNNDVFHSEKNGRESFIHPWSRYFSIGLLTIAGCASVFWFFADPSRAIPVFISVLIVACPCSLLLSATFTYGNMLRIFGNNNFFLRNANVIESLAAADTIVFDKTGTITEPFSGRADYAGLPLTGREKEMVACVTSQSTHPLSRIIAESFSSVAKPQSQMKDFREHIGEGVSGTVNGISIKMGSPSFVSPHNPPQQAGTSIHVKINDDVKGFYHIKNNYRQGLQHTVTSLKNDSYEMHVLSGDNNTEQSHLQEFFGQDAAMRFGFTPEQKLEYIKSLQFQNRKVLMIGDGINDAGALRQADAGIAVNNNNAHFTPASDVISTGDNVTRLAAFLKFARKGKTIVRASFILSLLYNVVGISFAVSAHLSPVVAAILMPASSISIVIFVTLASNAAAKRCGFKSVDSLQ